MAQPTFTPASPGDALNAAAWNALFTSVVTQSGNVQAVNIRDEGLDRNSIGLASVLSLSTQVVNNTATAVDYGDAGATVDMSSWTAVNHSGVLFRINNGGAGWTFDADKQIGIVRCSLEVRRVYRANNVAFRLVRSISGSGAVLMPYTYRRLEYIGVGGVTNHDYEAWDLTIAASLYEDGPYDWIELQCQIVTGAHNSAATRLWLSEGNISLQIWDR